MSGRSCGRGVALGLFFTALALYLLTYVGAFKLNDERALFASLDSLVKRGDFTANPIFWDYTNVGMLTTDGEMVPNYEPGQIVLPAPLYAVGAALGARVQAIMLWVPLVTALGVALLYLTMRTLGYGRRAALLAAFVFGAGTIVWPYSKSFYRDPQAMVASLGALYGLLRYRDADVGAWRWAALAGAFVGVALLTKDVSGIVLAPPVALLLLAGFRARVEGKGPKVRALVALLVPVALALLFYRLYFESTLANVETFSRNLAESVSNPQLSSSDLTRMARAAIGLTVSPFRGLFWYAPALLLGLVGAWPFLRRHRWEGLAFLALIGATLLGYSRYNYWSGGAAYGPRYLLGTIPFLVLLAAPVWAWLAEGRWRATRGGRAAALGAWALIALSVLFQLPGVLMDMLTFEHRYFQAVGPLYGGVGEAIDATFLSPRSSTVFGNARLLLDGSAPLDVAWAPLRPEGAQGFRPALLALLLANLATAVAGLWALWRWRGGRLVLPVLALAALGTMGGLLLIAREGDGRFDPYDVDRFLRPMLPTLDAVPCERAAGAPTRCEAVMVAPDPLLTDYFLTRLDGPLPWYAISQPPAAEDAALLEQLAARYPAIYLVRDRSAQADDEQGRRDAERLLAQLAFKVGEERVEEWARLIRYSGAGRPVERLAAPQPLGEMALAEATLLIAAGTSTPPRAGAPDRSPREPLDDGRVAATAGETLQIGLVWRAEEPPRANYTVFVQLLDEAGAVALQRDRPPGDGLFPTGAMAPGSTVRDNLALEIDLPPGRYRLIVGLYDPAAEGAPRLVGPGGDVVTLAEVEVGR